MDIQSLEAVKANIQSVLADGRTLKAVSILLGMHPADQAEVFNTLEEDQQDALLPLMNIAATADLLEELEDDDVLEVVDSFSTERLAGVLDEMEPDEAADLLGDLPPAQASEVLAQMEDAEDVIPLLGYPDETAGGLMTTSFIALRLHTTTEQAIQFLRQVSPDEDIPYYLFVVDRARALLGVVGLRELVISEPGTVMEDIMDRGVVFVDANADQEEVARVMARYDLAAVPVVDDYQRLLGVITYDDIVDVLEDEATEDIYRLATVSDTDLEPESPVTGQLKGRLPWLYLNMVLALLASWVITNFEDLIARVAILAAFLSVIAGLGGNSASQNVVMIVRSMALGKMSSRKLWSVLGRQIWVGFLLGIMVGSVVGVGVYIWRGDHVLALVLFAAMAVNMALAGAIGTVVPFLTTALGKDPALASSVLVTAATDIFGFLIFLGLASLVFYYFL
jgi:magnesium transporter